MQKKLWTRVGSLALTLGLLAGVLAGCGDSPGASESPTTRRPGGRQNPEDEISVSAILPDLTAQVREMEQQYPDTVGWLQIPGTSIDDVVVCSPQDNIYYMRRNLDGEYDFNGVYYADYQSDFGDGTAAGLGRNTCIYGHAMTDNEQREQYAIRFGPLHDYRNPEYARSMPYILFGTADKTLAFEVFAVFTTNSDNPALPYNRADMESADFLEMVRSQVLPRSLYHYEDVPLSESDKFLTLSTCIYTMPDGTRLNYETSEMRFVVMAKLVDPAAPLKERAVFTENQEVVLDPDGPWQNTAA